MCEVRIVPIEGKNGVRLFVSNDAHVAYKILPTKQKITVRATATTTINSKVRYNARRKQRYLKFAHALGEDMHILVSHAVHLAWIGPIPDGYVVDHLNGITTDNRDSNLQAITPQENARRVPYLNALRKLIPNHWQTFQRDDYLRFYAMPFAEFKAMLGKFKVEDPNKIMEYEMTHHMEC